MTVKVRGTGRNQSEGDESLSLTSRRGGWWLALPDAAAPPPEYQPGWPVIAWHPSGRPWLLGNLAVPVLTASAGPVTAAAIGDVLAEPAEFAKLLRQAVEHRDYDSLMTLPGSYHLAVREPARMLAYGDVAGLRRLYTAGYRGAAVISGRARVLAELCGVGGDLAWMAARMCAPAVPVPVRQTHSPFEGVAPVPAGCRVEIASGQVLRTARYWHPPPAQSSMEEGAGRVRAALESAVAGRVRRTGGPVTVALSGGLDSAALAALAVRAASADGVVLVTTPSAASSDLPWARLVADHLGVRHDVLDDAPPLFAGLPGVVPAGTDEPSAAVGAARMERTARALVGSRLHLNGQGGDEVLGAPLSHLGPLLRKRCRGAVRRLRGYAALHATSAARLAWHALAEQPYRSWLQKAAKSLDVAVDPVRDAVAWEAHPRLVSWASRNARHLAAEALVETVPEPWGDRPTHAALARIRASAAAAATYGQAMAELGGPVPVFPFFDRAVVEACLAVWPWERADPWVLKPLLVEAMRHALPEELLLRTTKGSYTPDIHRGWERHRETVLDLVRNPLLAEMGLIDLGCLRRTLAGWGAAGVPPAHVADLVALELWARTVHTDPARETA